MNTSTRFARVTRVLAVCAVAMTAAVAFADPAEAHIVAKPSSVKPGAEVTVGFVIPHGCGTYGTTALAMKLPTTISNVSVVAPKGWTGSIKNSVATFTGGPLDAKTKGTFTLKFTAPAKEGPLFFPTVQTCTVGKTGWTQPPANTGATGDRPAPRVNVTSKTPKGTETTEPAVH